MSSDYVVRITQREYGMVFEGGSAGEDIELCLLDFKNPVVNVTDFPMGS